MGLVVELVEADVAAGDLLRVKTNGVYVNDFSSFLERELGRVDLDTLNPSWLIFSDGFSAGQRLSSIGKRFFDIVVSLLILLIGVPLIALFSVLIKLETKGPAFFRQTRVGLFGQNFTLVKLRSMRTDAEAAGACPRSLSPLASLPARTLCSSHTPHFWWADPIAGCLTKQRSHLRSDLCVRLFLFHFPKVHL